MNTVINTHMESELLEKLPAWCKDFTPQDYYLVMTDDADSILSCQRLKTLFGLEIGGFYSFESGLWLNDEVTDNEWKTPIYVDLSVSDGYAFDNHYTVIKNTEKVNPNLYQRDKYYQKYCGSTLMLLASLYGGVDRMNETLRTVLLCVDGFYIGYYKDGGRYKNINLWWLEKLGLTEYLLPILEAHDKQYFIDFMSKYQLREKVWIDDEGLLHCPAFGVPGIKFNNEFKVDKVFADRNMVLSMKRQGKPIFCSASTYENAYVLNLKQVS